MLPLFKDAIDLACFRVKPVSHYAYTWWQPVLWLTVLGALPALGATDLKASVPVLMVFFIAMTWLQALALTLFFAWWLKLGKRWGGQGTLFPLVVLATSSQLLEPLLSAVPPSMVLPLTGLLAFYQIAVLTQALNKATGVGMKHVLLGLLAYLPTALILGLLALSIAGKAGWLPPLPAEAVPVTQQEQN